MVRAIDLVALAVVFLDDGVGIAVDVFVLLAHRQQRHRVVAAGGRAVAVDVAAFRLHEAAGGAALDRTELDAGDAVLLHLVGHRVVLEELGGRDAQARLHAQDVVGRQRNVDVGTAGVPAADALVAGELDGGFSATMVGTTGLLGNGISGWDMSKSEVRDWIRKKQAGSLAASGLYVTASRA
jgi:hypothetical protein